MFDQTVRMKLVATGIAIGSLALAIGWQSPAWAQSSSLYQRDQQGHISLPSSSLTYRETAPPREIKLNDLVSVIVIESSQLISEGEFTGRKNLNLIASLREWFEFDGLNVTTAPLANGEPTALLDLNQSFDNLTPQFSPDGKRLLCKVKHYGSYKPLGSGSLDRTDFKFNDLLEIDLATKKRTVVKELGEKPEWRIAGFAWSPDGGRTAYVETKSLPRPPGQSADAFRVTVCDPDGRNAKVIHTAERSWLVGFDWK